MLTNEKLTSSSPMSVNYREISFIRLDYRGKLLCNGLSTSESDLHSASAFLK
jgi:hypothetical protein